MTAYTVLEACYLVLNITLAMLNPLKITSKPTHMCLFVKALSNRTSFMITAIILLPFAIAGQTSLEKYTLEYWNLKGKVSYMEEIKYSADESMNGLQKGKVLQKEIHRFDTEGNLLEEEMYINREFRRKTYTYNKSGKIIAYESYNERGLSYFSTYDYDITGKHVTDENGYNKDGSLSSKIKKQYDARGNQTEFVAYSPDGRMTTKTTYVYNDKGYLTEEHLKSIEPNLFEVTWTSKYDAKGNRIGLDRYDPGRPVYKQTFAFDANGNKIEDNVLNDDGSVKQKVTYAYDAQKNKTEIMEIGSDGTLKFITTYTYEYDSQKNWTNSIYTVNKVPKYIYVRTIKYHP